jgi:hypothetical protein
VFEVGSESSVESAEETELQWLLRVGNPVDGSSGQRTRHALRGRRESWLAEDLEVAQSLTNSLPKDAGLGALPRGEVFRSRKPIPEEVRAAFRRTVKEEAALEREARGILKGEVLSRAKQAQIDRKAIRRALVAHGILNIRKRRVSLTLKSIFRAKIS